MQIAVSILLVRKHHEAGNGRTAAAVFCNGHTTLNRNVAAIPHRCPSYQQSAKQLHLEHELAQKNDLVLNLVSPCAPLSKEKGQKTGTHLKGVRTLHSLASDSLHCGMDVFEPSARLRVYSSAQYRDLLCKAATAGLCLAELHKEHNIVC